jgi:hypothetical protein
MPQKTLIRSPVTTPTKNTIWGPKWIIQGHPAPKPPVGDPPVVVDIPYASASSLSVAASGIASCTKGNWENEPTSYTYQWMRDGVAIGGATASTHALVAGDVGHSLTCVVTAHTTSYAKAAPPSNAVGPVVA